MNSSITSSNSADQLSRNNEVPLNSSFNSNNDSFDSVLGSYAFTTRDKAAAALNQKRQRPSPPSYEHVMRCRSQSGQSNLQASQLQQRSRSHEDLARIVRHQEIILRDQTARLNALDRGRLKFLLFSFFYRLTD